MQNSPWPTFKNIPIALPQIAGWSKSDPEHTNKHLVSWPKGAKEKWQDCSYPEVHKMKRDWQNIGTLKCLQRNRKGKHGIVLAAKFPRRQESHICWLKSSNTTQVCIAPSFPRWDWHYPWVVFGMTYMPSMFPDYSGIKYIARENKDSSIWWLAHSFA